MVKWRRKKVLIKLYSDRNNNPINTEKIYMDVRNKVTDVHIIEIDGNYYAKPDGLDEEPLGSACNGLVEQI